MEEAKGKPTAVAVVTEPRFTQRYKEHLEKLQKPRIDGTVWKSWWMAPCGGYRFWDRPSLSSICGSWRNRVAPGSTCNADAAPGSCSFKEGQHTTRPKTVARGGVAGVEGRGGRGLQSWRLTCSRSWQRHGDLCCWVRTVSKPSNGETSGTRTLGDGCLGIWRPAFGQTRAGVPG